MGTADTIVTIHTSETFLPKGVPPVAMLYPFWEQPTDPTERARYLRYVKEGHRYFRLTSASTADFHVLPFDWRYTTIEFAGTRARADHVTALAREFMARAATSGKKVIVFFVSDSDDAVPFADSIVFRTSIERGLRSNEFAMAAFVDDPVTERLASHLPVRPKLTLPSVGFCGFAGYRLSPDVDFLGRSRARIRWLRRGAPGPTTRERAIVQLRRHPSVLTQFILRENPKGGDVPGPRQRDDFLRTLLETDYTLCARGRGNWSVRFFETVALGRVPLFIDTSSSLPYDFAIDYRRLSVWVTAEHIDDVAKELVSFHDGMTQSEFVELQRACRQLWQDRLTPHGFFSHFHEHFDAVS
jgi:hypothetical protein